MRDVDKAWDWPYNGTATVEVRWRLEGQEVVLLAFFRGGFPRM